MQVPAAPAEKRTVGQFRQLDIQQTKLGKLLGILNFMLLLPVVFLCRRAKIVNSHAPAVRQTIHLRVDVRRHRQVQKQPFFGSMKMGTHPF